MNDVFNSPFEVSLRILLALESHKSDGITVDMLVAVDFIAVYGKDFGISDSNLHGDNNFKFSEFAVRRDIIKKAVKQLVLDNLVTASVESNGFTYTINEKGQEYCRKLGSDYAVAYKEMVNNAWAYIKQKSDREVIELINQHSVTSIRGGRLYG